MGGSEGEYVVLLGEGELLEQLDFIVRSDLLSLVYTCLVGNVNSFVVLSLVGLNEILSIHLLGCFWSCLSVYFKIRGDTQPIQQTNCSSPCSTYFSHYISYYYIIYLLLKNEKQ